MMNRETLVEKIEETRITYPETEHGVTIRGSPFNCEFDSEVDPVAVCDEIKTADDPWRMFGVKSRLAEDYWKVVGTLFHVENGDVVDTSEIAVEVCPVWMRVYVKEDCSAERAASFVEALDEEYGVTVKFVDRE